MAENKVYKVVINNSYGGFSIPEEGLEFLASRGVHVDEWGGRVDENGNRIRGKIARHNPHLVELVEKLMEKDECDEDGYALHTLSVREISCPSYVVREYDGAEWVMTLDKFKSELIHIEEV